MTAPSTAFRSTVARDDLLQAMRTTDSSIRLCTPSILLEQDRLANSLAQETSISDGRVSVELARQREFLREIYGADVAVPFTNGSTGAAQVIAATLQRDATAHVLIARASHLSVPGALDRAGVGWEFIAEADYDPQFEAVGPVTASQLRLALKTSAVTPSAIWIVSPTYEGLHADVGALLRVRDEAAPAAAMIVDAAWGAHLPFHPTLVLHDPFTAGADVVTTSLHKQGGASQGSALLLASRGSRLHPALLAAEAGELATTSPNFSLLASISAAVRVLASPLGCARIEELIRASTSFTEQVSTQVPALRLLARDSRFADQATDPVKLTAGLAGLGITGRSLAADLEARDVIVEKAGPTSVTMLATFQSVRRLPEAAQRIIAAIKSMPSRSVRPSLVDPFGGPALERIISGLDARRAPHVRVPFTAAVGRIAAETVACYPPGVPVVVAGTVIQAHHVAVLQETHAHGGALHHSNPSRQGCLSIVA